MPSHTKSEYPPARCPQHHQQPDCTTVGYGRFCTNGPFKNGQHRLCRGKRWDTIFNVLYMSLGFLRMGTSGFTAQSFGAKRRQSAGPRAATLAFGGDVAGFNTYPVTVSHSMGCFLPGMEFTLALPLPNLCETP